MSTDLIKERISGLGILPELTGIGESSSVEISTRFIHRMHKNIYPLICGTDHDRLIYFYSLLADCESSDGSAQNHVRLLKKLKSIGIDYKQLTDAQHDPLDIIRPVLSQDNVSAIAKLAPYIHDNVIAFCSFSAILVSDIFIAVVTDS